LGVKQILREERVERPLKLWPFTGKSLQNFAGSNWRLKVSPSLFWRRKSLQMLLLAIKDNTGKLGEKPAKSPFSTGLTTFRQPRYPEK
jgi:hypothetical protein